MCARTFMSLNEPFAMHAFAFHHASRRKNFSQALTTSAGIDALLISLVLSDFAAAWERTPAPAAAPPGWIIISSSATTRTTVFAHWQIADGPGCPLRRAKGSTCAFLKCPGMALQRRRASSDASPLREQKRKCRNPQFSSEFDPELPFANPPGARNRFQRLGLSACFVSPE